jgi:Holliday junction resolvasome RuvABC ATP-dependent DNA helicase subunit
VSTPSRFQHIADDLWQLSLSELRHFQGVISKIMAAKEAIETVSENSAEERDREAAVVLKEIRDYLENDEVALSGPEAVVLASFCKHQEGTELLDSKGLNIFLDSYGRKPANTTTVVDKLGKRRLVKIEDDGPHSHKKFQLTDSGMDEAWDIVSRLGRGRGRPRLTAVS